jgi:quercetin dioxygenase-like cupin family protein
MRKMNRLKPATLLGLGARPRLYAVVACASFVLISAAAYAAVTQILAVGTIAHSELFDGPATVTVRTLTVKPGETLAWHYHPGYAFNVVKSGTLTQEAGCGGEETLTAGQAFEELHGHVHRAKNLSATEDLVIYNTFIVPQGRPTTVNIPGNEPRCGPPADVSECMGDGWAGFNFPNPFNNQGECVQFVRHLPHLILPVPLDPLQ